MTATTKNPMFYRNALKAVKRDESGGRDMDVRNQLLGLGFQTIEELQARADDEELQSKPPRLTAAERALAVAQNAVEQAEAARSAELARFKQIEQHRQTLFRLESARSQISGLADLKAEQESVLSRAAELIVADATATSPDVNAGLRMQILVSEWSRLDLLTRSYKQAIATLDSQVTEAERALTSLEADAAEIRAVATAH